jgi:hypothetical protein
MRGYREGEPGGRVREALLTLTLLGHVLAVSGLPKATSSHKKDASQPYPCQDQPCGCHSAEECWAGDCCCFTLHEKLAWAEARGLEPPQQARRLARARKASPAPPAPCCRPGRGGQNFGPPAGLAASDPEPGRPAAARDRIRRAACCEAPARGCPACVPPVAAECRDRTTSTGAPLGRWVVGILAQKCRGEGLAGLLKLDPSVPTESLSPPLPPEPVAVHSPSAARVTPTSLAPPAPPPRHS